jgi:hypothetical protein
MSNTYTLTVQESDKGVLSVTNVERTVRVNQHRVDSKRMSPNAFGFVSAADPQSMTKRAARKTR